MTGNNGIHTFTSEVTLKTAGIQTVSVNDTIQPSTTGTSGDITVSPASASALVFSTQPGSATAGAVFAQQPVVKSQDGFGNDSTVGLATTNNVTVTVASGTGTLQGTTVLNIGTAGGNGTVSFTNLRIDAAGPRRRCRQRRRVWAR